MESDPTCVRLFWAILKVGRFDSRHDYQIHGRCIYSFRLRESRLCRGDWANSREIEAIGVSRLITGQDVRWLYPRDLDEIVVLGSGRSMLDYSREEIERINRAQCVIAVNKYMVYYDILGIVPTHIWFTDDHGPSLRVLQYIWDVCRRDRLRGLTFVMHRNLKYKIYPTRFRHLKGRVGGWLKRQKREILRVPFGCQWEFVGIADWMSGGEWAESLDEPMFHFRGSFTSVMNYVTVCHPGKRVMLLGVDFNSPGYFFDREMEARKHDWSDWTTNVQRTERKHFGAIEYEGTTVFDVFPRIRQELDARGVTLYCPNRDSEVVRRNLATYSSEVLPTKAPANSNANEGAAGQ